MHNIYVYVYIGIACVVYLVFATAITSNNVNRKNVNTFVQVRRKPFNWLSNESWLNVLELSQSSKFFSNLPNDMAGNESMWRR